MTDKEAIRRLRVLYSELRHDLTEPEMLALDRAIFLLQQEVERGKQG